MGFVIGVMGSARGVPRHLVSGFVQERANRIRRIVATSSAGLVTVCSLPIRYLSPGSRSMRSLSLRSLSMRLPMRSPMRLPAHLLSACLLLTLAACATPQQRAARNQADVERMMVEYGPACERLGYPPDSDGWRGCVLRLNAQEDLNRYSTPGYYDGGGPRWYGNGGWWRPIW